MAKKVGIQIVVDDNGAIKSFKQLGNAGESATQKISGGANVATSSMGELNLKTAITAVSITALAVGAFKLGKSILGVADDFTLLSSQLKLVIDDGNTVEKLQRQLLGTANETRQSLKSTTQLYSRLDRATQELGLTDEKVLSITEVLNKAILISGATSAESEAAVIQLSQGMAAGALRGEELNSVLEQTPRVAKLIADGMGVTLGELRKLGAQGALTTEAVVNAVTGQSDIINEEFKKVGKTTGQGFTVLGNIVKTYVSELAITTEAQKIVNIALDKTGKAIESLAVKQTKLQELRSKGINERTIKEQFKIVSLLRNERYQLEEKQKLAKEEGEVFGAANKNRLSTLDRLITAERALFKQKKIISENEKKNAPQAERRLNQLIAENNLKIAIANTDKTSINVNDKIIDQQNKRADFFNNVLENERARSKEYAEYDQMIAKEKLELEQTLNLERDALGATQLEITIARIDQETEKRLEAAGTIAQTETELIELVESIGISAEGRKNEARKKTAEINRKASEEDVRLAIKGAQLAANAASQIFDDSKLAATAKIGVSTAVATMRLYEDFPLPAALALTPFVVGAGLKSVADVNRQKFADGTDYVTGAGTNRSDSIPASLSVGERVVDSATNSLLGGISNSELADAVRGGGATNITINAGAGTDVDALAQAVTNAVHRANQLRLEPQI